MFVKTNLQLLCFCGIFHPVWTVTVGMAPYACYNLIVVCVSHVIISCLTLNNCSRLINSQTCAGVTATYLAAQQGHLEVLRYLVEEGGASLKILCHDRRSCLQAAAQTGQLETIQWLVRSIPITSGHVNAPGALYKHVVIHKMDGNDIIHPPTITTTGK